MVRNRSLVLASILALALASCGGGGGGGGGGSGAASTLSGNVSNQSQAMRMTAPTTIVARLLRFLSPVTEALAGRNGIQVEVNGIQTETDQNGFFTITGPFSGVVTVSFGTGNRNFAMQVDVPPGATVVLRDVDLRDNGTADPERTDVDLRGSVVGASCNTTPQTLTVDVAGQNVTVELDALTRIQISGPGPSDRTCAELANATGQRVRVEAIRRADGSLLAERVKVNPEAVEQAAQVEFRGTVTALNCPSSITVLRTDGQTVTVQIVSSTEFGDASGCSALAGRQVKVEGSMQNGAVVATEIEVEDELEI